MLYEKFGKSDLDLTCVKVKIGGYIMLENGKDICNCVKKSCIRHGNCKECIDYHKADNRRLPYCKRKVINKKKVLMLCGFGILFIALLIGVGVFSTIKIMEKKYPEVSGMTIHNVTLSLIDDGVYKGNFSYGKSVYEVEVSIEKGKYSSIIVSSNRDDKYVKRAEEIIQRVIEKQSLDVDVISGATRSSKAILKAIENAF